jgi:RNA polymerase sigma-70 factor (ECF subfamily)
LYREETVYVRRTLRRLGVPGSDVADLTQDVFLVVWRKRDHYDPLRPLRPWLFGVTLRVCLGHRRRPWSRSRTRLEREVVEARDGPEEHLARAERNAAVAGALSAVSARVRKVLVLHDIEGQTMRDIAALEDLPLKTAYSRLRLARQQLRRALARLDR